ncbi:SLC13 family permease [Sinorhizobium sp. BG8]|uniref:SLC13 family permease n=1 Tax=Sinorhizobium sp. BG8 TaxID=2613773 RepID=UPI001FED7CD9|nr:SLC13 family permease [Sinorhizobium sp. BG8]
MVSAALEETECLQLWPAPKTKPTTQPPLLLCVFALGVLLAAFDIVSPQIAFGVAILLLMLLGQLNLREALASLNWPIVVMLACMIPLAGAMQTTGAAEMIASSLAAVLPMGYPSLAVALMLLLAVALTPFINNASVVIALTPISLEIAQSFNCPPAALLIAIAVGASLDFLTPFGHHNNTLVMGIGGYRFADFPRAGWPVTVVTVVAAFLSIVVFWL